MNKNRPKGNQKHIDLSGRIRIEQGLNNGESFRTIARDLSKDPSTISKEVRRHSVIKERKNNSSTTSTAAPEVTVFKNPVHPEFGNLRTIEIDGEPWFVGKDVAAALGYTKERNALDKHVEDEDKTTALIQGTGSNYKSKTILINESGLYSLILSSKLPSAKEFKHWVTSEV